MAGRVFESMRAQVTSFLRGIDRYNPENLATLERYVEVQCRENAYDLEANLAILKLYQFNPVYFQSCVVCQILLKALTNLPHTDFTLAKCLIDQQLIQDDEQVERIFMLAELLETCHFTTFWRAIAQFPDAIAGITGFEDSIRKFICHVIGITYQNIEKEHLIDLLGGMTDQELQQWIKSNQWEDRGHHVFVSNQEEQVKTKNIRERIEFDKVADIMTTNNF